MAEPMRLAEQPQEKLANKRYCSAINCSNRSAYDIDERTGKFLRYHRFPDPVKKRDLCLKWISNVRRPDLNLDNVKHKSVCAVHFEVKAYACHSDIASSRLLPSAVPTLIQCPNPPATLTPHHPPPKDGSTIPPPSKKRKVASVGTGITEASPRSEPLLSTSPPSKHLFRVKILEKELDKKEKELRQSKDALRHVRADNYLLKRKIQRLVERSKRHEAVELQLRRKMEELKQQKLSSMLDHLPVIPKAMCELLLRTKKVTDWRKEQATLELCLSLFFKSSSAYSVLRASGFPLPHPSTLRKQFSSVLPSPMPDLT